MEQLSLFELGVDMSALRQQRAELAAAAVLAANTRRAYDSDFRRFSRWCERAGRSPLPALPDTLALYLTSVVAETQSVASADRYAWAIARRHSEAGHPSPIGPEVREVLDARGSVYHAVVHQWRRDNPLIGIVIGVEAIPAPQLLTRCRIVPGDAIAAGHHDFHLASIFEQRRRLSTRATPFAPAVRRRAMKPAMATRRL